MNFGDIAGDVYLGRVREPSSHRLCSTTIYYTSILVFEYCGDVPGVFQVLQTPVYKSVMSIYILINISMV